MFAVRGAGVWGRDRSGSRSKRKSKRKSKSNSNSKSKSVSSRDKLGRAPAPAGEKIKSYEIKYNTQHNCVFFLLGLVRYLMMYFIFMSPWLTWLAFAVPSSLARLAACSAHCAVVDWFGFNTHTHTFARKPSGKNV